MTFQSLALLTASVLTCGMMLHARPDAPEAAHRWELRHPAPPAPDAFVRTGDLILDADVVRPLRWQKKLKRCTTRKGRRFCDGPRMVPVATPQDAARADRLGLGGRPVASRVLSGAPDAAWVARAGVARSDLRWPLDGGHVGRGYGYVRRNELAHRRHDGIDFAAKPGTPVRTVNDGLVVYADNGVSGFGNLVMVVHADGSSSLYAHLRAALVTAGQRVLRGQVIGEVGNTGLSRGPHLHFEWRHAGRPVDPMHALRREVDGGTAPLASRAAGTRERGS